MLQLRQFLSLPPEIAVVTTIVGNYEVTCKKHINHSIPTDCIVYTDNPHIHTTQSGKLISININMVFIQYKRLKS